MPRIGYARVSTADQDLETQLAKLKAEGCGIIRSEKVSGGSRDGRTELATIIEFLRPGDELVVTRLDRLGRDTRDVLNIVHDCDQRQAFATVLDPHVSTRGEADRIVLAAEPSAPCDIPASRRTRRMVLPTMRSRSPTAFGFAARRFLLGCHRMTFPPCWMPSSIPKLSC
jgi:hypothetical protein